MDVQTRHKINLFLSLIMLMIIADAMLNSKVIGLTLLCVYWCTYYGVSMFLDMRLRMYRFEVQAYHRYLKGRISQRPSLSAEDLK